MDNLASLRTLIILSLVACAALLPGCREQPPPPTDANTQRVVIGDSAFDLELALDKQTRFTGLSDRKVISPDKGMLFVFPKPSVLQFVMRRCLVPIDIIFLDPAGRVVAMHAMEVEPPGTPEQKLRRYSSRWPAQFAIELAGGTIGPLGLQAGQKIELPLPSLKARAR